MLLFLSEVHRCFIDFVESSWDLDGSEIFFRDVVWNSSRNCQIWNMLECKKKSPEKIRLVSGFFTGVKLGILRFYKLRHGTLVMAAET